MEAFAIPGAGGIKNAGAQSKQLLSHAYKCLKKISGRKGLMFF